MTAYGRFAILNPNALHSLLSHDRVKEDKEARRKLLGQVEQRRRENYKRYYVKLKTTSRFNT